MKFETKLGFIAVHCIHYYTLSSVVVVLMAAVVSVDGAVCVCVCVLEEWELFRPARCVGGRRKSALV